jgi:hypothetical protein
MPKYSKRTMEDLDPEQREKVLEVLAEHDTPAADSVLDRLGIVGYAKDLPADYSTNEDYMKDFGRERSSDDTSNHDA